MKRKRHFGRPWWAVLLLVLSGSVVAGDQYGAFAYSDSSGRYGFGYDFPTQQEAEARATLECGRYAADCRNVLWFRNACGALAKGSENLFGVAWATDQQAAERRALELCSAKTEGCRVIRSICTGAAEQPADQPVVDPVMDLQREVERVQGQAEEFLQGIDGEGIGNIFSILFTLIIIITVLKVLKGFAGALKGLANAAGQTGAGRPVPRGGSQKREQELAQVMRDVLRTLPGSDIPRKQSERPVERGMPPAPGHGLQKESDLMWGRILRRHGEVMYDNNRQRRGLRDKG